MINTRIKSQWEIIQNILCAQKGANEGKLFQLWWSCVVIH